ARLVDGGRVDHGVLVDTVDIQGQVGWATEVARIPDRVVIAERPKDEVIAGFGRAVVIGDIDLRIDLFDHRVGKADCRREGEVGRAGLCRVQVRVVVV